MFETKNNRHEMCSGILEIEYDIYKNILQRAAIIDIQSSADKAIISKIIAISNVLIVHIDSKETNSLQLELKEIRELTQNKKIILVIIERDCEGSSGKRNTENKEIVARAIEKKEREITLKCKNVDPHAETETFINLFKGLINSFILAKMKEINSKNNLLSLFNNYKFVQNLIEKTSACEKQTTFQFDKMKRKEYELEDEIMQIESKPTISKEYYEENEEKILNYKKELAILKESKKKMMIAPMINELFEVLIDC